MTNRSSVRGHTDQTGPHCPVPRVDTAADLRYGTTGDWDRLSGEYDVGRHERK